MVFVFYLFLKGSVKYTIYRPFTRGIPQKITLRESLRVIFISYRPETRGIPQKITPRNISSLRVIFCGIPRVKGL